MKRKAIVIKINYLLVVLLITVVFLICFIIFKNTTIIKEKSVIIKEPEQIEYSNKISQSVSNQIYNERQPYKNIPQYIDGYEVIGKLEIPKINLSTYILAETNDKTLNKSVTKLCGPMVNGIGNFCITGHNYKNKKMFGNLKKLEINDKIYLTDIYDRTIEYVVYDIFKVKPNEVECLSQETKGEREVTLITCTTGAIKRLIVKCTELYD